MKKSLPVNSAICYCKKTKSYLLFQNPIKIIAANSVTAVADSFTQIEQLTAAGSYAAGFVTYEAAPAFDSSFIVKPVTCKHLPLVWFGIYEKPLEYASLSDFTDTIPLPQISLEPDTGKSEYHQAIQRIKQFIAQGDTYQVNYTNRMHGVFPHDPLQFFVSVRQSGTHDYSAYIETENVAVCSFSPELFFEKENNTIRSKPMKGTIERGLSSDSDAHQAHLLQNSGKNRAENIMIADMVRNDLGKICEPGSVSVKNICAVEPYPTVWQMTTTVEGQSDCKVGSIFKAMFPAASITGAPKTSTMRILSLLETSPRHLYTGSIGYITPTGNACFNVSIRTLVIDKTKKTAEYGAGGGIVWDSTAENEYQEMQQKTQIIYKSLPAFDLLETMLWEKSTGFYLLDLHLSRLEKSAAYFGYPFDREKFTGQIHQSVDEGAKSNLKIRVLLSKSGYADVQAAPIETEKFSFKCMLALQPVDSKDVFLYHKTTHRHIYEKAKSDFPQADDVILYNENHEITEGTRTNILFLKNGKWLTPPVSCGLLPGTYRESLIQSGHLQEGILRKEDIDKTDGLYLINSVRGKVPVKLIQ